MPIATYSLQPNSDPGSYGVCNNYIGQIKNFILTSMPNVTLISDTNPSGGTTYRTVIFQLENCPHYFKIFASATTGRIGIGNLYINGGVDANMRVDAEYAYAGHVIKIFYGPNAFVLWFSSVGDVQHTGVVYAKLDNGKWICNGSSNGTASFMYPDSDNTVNLILPTAPIVDANGNFTVMKAIVVYAGSIFGTCNQLFGIFDNKSMVLSGFYYSGSNIYMVVDSAMIALGDG